MPILFVVVLVVATVAIAALCWSWMQSTRASQRKVDEQNRRIIELLEEIAAKIRDERNPPTRAPSPR